MRLQKRPHIEKFLLRFSFTYSSSPLVNYRAYSCINCAECFAEDLPQSKITAAEGGKA